MADSRLALDTPQSNEDEIKISDDLNGLTEEGTASSKDAQSISSEDCLSEHEEVDVVTSVIRSKDELQKEDLKDGKNENHNNMKEKRRNNSIGDKENSRSDRFWNYIFGDLRLSPVCPEKNSSYFSQLCFSWVTELVRCGKANPQIQSDDLWDLPEEEKAFHLYQKFDKLYERRKNKSLIITMFLFVRGTLSQAALCMGIYAGCQLGNPLLLRGLVLAVNDGKFEGIYYSLGLFFSTFCAAFANQRHYHLSFRCGQRLRALVIALVYRHTLQINSAAHENIDQGKIVNLVGNDSQKLFELMPFINLLWAAPIQICIVTYFLIRFLGIPALAGVGMLISLVPISLFLSSAQRYLRVRHVPATDKRVNLISELLFGMRIVKLFSWEKPFSHKANKLRNKEIKFILLELYQWAFMIFILIVFPVMAMMVTFTAYVKITGPLNSGDTFAALAFFNVLKFPLMYLGQAGTYAIQAHIAVKRLGQFLKTKSCEYQPGHEHDNDATHTKTPISTDINDNEIEDFSVDQMLPAQDSNAKFLDDDDDADGNDNNKIHQAQVLKTVGENDTLENISKLRKESESRTAAVCYRDAAFAWSSQQDSFRLRHLNLTIEKGEIVAVIGEVGSGKSMFVQSCLGETLLVEGSKRVIGTTVYVAQESFIMNASVRDNIIFGLPFDEARYREVLSACELWRDISSWADGDGTMIGERGVTLSGGQKARVSLARATYRESDIYLFDDPLSALDAYTGKRVFNNVVSNGKGLLKDNSTRILVTHAVQFLSLVDRVLVLHEGEILYNGSFQQLERFVGQKDSIKEECTVAGSSMDVQALSGSGQKPETEQDQLQFNRKQEILYNVLHSRTQEDQEHDDEAKLEEKEQKEEITPAAAAAAEEEKNDLNDKKGELMSKEESKSGKVGISTYWTYIQAGGGLFWVIPFILVLMCERFTFIGADWWLAVWSSAENSPPDDKIATKYDFPAANTPEGNSFYLNGYIGIAFTNMFFVFCRTFGMATGGAFAAKNLFRKLLTAVLNSPMSFFETTPMGRILSRFVYDTEVTDFLLPTQLNAWIASSWWIISSLVVMVFVTYYSLVGLIPIMIIFLTIQNYYRMSCLQYQRLDNTTRSPIQAMFSETLNGMVTLRAFMQTDRFVKVNDDLIDRNIRAVQSFTSSQRWLGLRLEVLGSFITLLVSMLCWVSRNTLTGGLAGLAVMWTFNITTSFNFYVTFATQAEAKMNAIERISYYIENLTNEHDNENKEAPENWPSKGEVVFRDVKLRYREDIPLALKGLTATIQPGERVGIVGRTGAGKSTISVALFRLCNLAGGQILIDGVDLATLPLKNIRGNRICIIPQDPVLFAGTIRSNLDPFDEFEDHELWDALKFSRMDNTVKELDMQLLSKVTSQAGNFSVGQRQLFCLARALLRKPRVLVMDEATASVDSTTDMFIQETVRFAFENTTIIEIAHRMHSVMDADRVLVMGDGQVQEFGTPHDLLQLPSSQFSALVNATGKESASQLRSMALKKQQTSSKLLRSLSTEAYDVDDT